MGDFWRFPRWLSAGASLFHVGSLAWGILTEALYWPCPLTLAENALEQKAGIQPYRAGFIVHYFDKIIYPDISANILTTVAVTLCTFNLGFYVWRAFVPRHSHNTEPRTAKRDFQGWNK